MRPEQQFATQPQYEQAAFTMSGGAPSTSGMPAYPLYGYPPLGQTDDVPVYRRPLVCFGAGATLVGLAWAYFAWWRPMKTKAAKMKKNEEP